MHVRDGTAGKERQGGQGAWWGTWGEFQELGTVCEGCRVAVGCERIGSRQRGFAKNCCGL